MHLSQNHPLGSAEVHDRLLSGSITPGSQQVTLLGGLGPCVVFPAPTWAVCFSLCPTLSCVKQFRNTLTA